MLYNAPYGVSDPNAPYINGDPSIGQAGSIPPAASIEFPQREIVECINATGLVPTNGDLTQLRQALQVADVFNHFRVATNGGSASQWSAAVPTLPVMPPPKGAAIWFYPGYESGPSGVVFSVNGSAFVPVVHPDLTQITVGDIIPTGWVLLFFDGTHWQLVAGGTTRMAGQLPMLQHNTDWYVNHATGNDNNDGTAAAPGGGTVGPFQTIQRACNEVVKYNMNGYDQTVHIAAGIYQENVSLLKLNGSGFVTLLGDTTTPSNVVIAPPQNSAVLTALGCGTYFMRGLKFVCTSTSSAGDAGAGLGVQGAGSWVGLSNCEFGGCVTRMMLAGDGGVIELLGWLYASGTFLNISGATSRVMEVNGAGSSILLEGPILNITGTPHWTTAFAVSSALGMIAINVYTGPPFQSINGSATGVRYAASMNGIVATGQGAGYLPGDTIGTTSTGGQYS